MTAGSRDSHQVAETTHFAELQPYSIGDGEASNTR